MLVLFYTSLTGCLTDPDCTLSDDLPDFDSLETVTGSVIELILTDIYQEEIFGEDYTEAEYVINDDSLYNVWKQNAQNACGSTCSFPDIDFTTRTLIGKYYQLACTQLPAVRVTKEGNTYTHVVKRVDNTQCLQAACFNYTFAFVSVPKIDSTATVMFRTGSSRYICTNC